MILKYQARFRLPDVAINSLIKFFWIVLSDADNERFKNFPTSSYMMRKMLEFGKHSKRYAVCQVVISYTRNQRFSQHPDLSVIMWSF